MRPEKLWNMYLSRASEQIFCFRHENQAFWTNFDCWEARKKTISIYVRLSRASEENLGFRLSLEKVNLAWRFKEITFTPGKVNLEWRKNCCKACPVGCIRITYFGIWSGPYDFCVRLTEKISQKKFGANQTILKGATEAIFFRVINIIT